MSTKILFGNNVGYKINNYLIKKKIIDYLQKNIDSFSLKNNLILSKDNLTEIHNNEYNVLANLEGIEYLFVVIKLNNFYCLCLIEKKTLNDFNNINYNDLNIIHVKIRVNNLAYKGTIFEGRIVNLGGPSKTIYNFAKKYNKKIKKIFSKGEFPQRTDMNLKKLRKIIR